MNVERHQNLALTSELTIASLTAVVVKMLMTARALIAIGVLLTASALAPSSWDFAVAITPSWHMTVFPAPLWVGAIVVLIGIVVRLVSLR